MADVVKNSCGIAMFADDSKCYKCITSVTDCAALHANLDAISTWANQNELEFQRKRFSFNRAYTD